MAECLEEGSMTDGFEEDPMAALMALSRRPWLMALSIIQWLMALSIIHRLMALSIISRRDLRKIPFARKPLDTVDLLLSRTPIEGV
jgi:hypothetical protein